MAIDKVRVTDFIQRKQRGEKLVVLTAYDATMAHLLDAGGIDALLVGDSLGTVIMGEETTLPVTLDAMVHHTRAVSRGASRALVIADMPFLSYQVNADEAVRHAGRLLQDGNAAAVKLEGGRTVAATVRRLTDVGIPVMGHLGLMPQSVHAIGGYRRRRLDDEGIAALLEDALALQEAGAFAVVLEAVPANAAARVTAELDIPTIGIGAGPDCDGQVLVSYDMLGLLGEQVPSFVRRYATLADTVRDAARAYADDVRQGRFPGGDVGPAARADHEPQRGQS